MASQPQDSKIDFVDLPGVSETYVDSIESFYMDDNTMRLTFTITRWTSTGPSAEPTGKKYPVCRLAMSLPCAQDLYNRLRNLAEVIAAQEQPQEPPTIQ